MIRSALAAVIAAAAVMPAAAEVGGVPIGAWRFGSPIRLQGQPRSYFVSINTDEGDRLSPSLVLLCTRGKFSLQLIDGHLSSPRWAGAMRVRVDDTAAITLTARAVGIGDPIAQIESSPLPLAAVAQLRTAHAQLTVSLGGWSQTFAFPAHGASAAIGALIAVCTPEEL